MVLKSNQRKAMFAKMNSLQRQQISLLNNTFAAEIKMKNKDFVKKEVNLLIQTDKLTTKAIKRLDPDDSLKVVIASDRIKDALVRKAIISGMKVNRKKLSPLK